jgi:predicted AlkP superfamily pyrophosphatase or phosphodiesterase
MRTSLRSVVFISLLALLHTGCTQDEPTGDSPPIKLLLLITIDQLRGVTPALYRDDLEGGLAHLLANGTWYSNAHYSHASTFTATGHATIATGAGIKGHGIAANDWYEQGGNGAVYSVGDPEHGRSPVNLTAETIGDVLIRTSGGESRVFSVSLKDRGSILLGGHDGKAFWYSWRDGNFVSSTYYFDELPDWVEQWNTHNSTVPYIGKTWNLLKEPALYRRLDADDRPEEHGVRKPQRGVPFPEEEVALDLSFPHDLSGLEGTAYFHTLRHTPFADMMTADFARELMAEEKLGAGSHTDMLAISFSATDYIGHAFGPESLEAEDNLYWLDQTLGELFRFIDRRIGLEHTLIVLSSDHGVAPIPEVLLAEGIPAGRHKPAEDILRINDALSARFGTDEGLVNDSFKPPSFYLDRDAVARAGLDVDEIAAAAAGMLEAIPGIKRAIPRKEFMSDFRFTTPEEQRLALAFHPERSGDVMVIQDKNWYLSPDWEAYAAMHGSPYDYDTHVPVIFSGPGIPASNYDRLVHIRDIAPTLAALLGIATPEDSTGTILMEIIKQ